MTTTDDEQTQLDATEDKGTANDVVTVPVPDYINSEDFGIDGSSEETDSCADHAANNDVFDHATQPPFEPLSNDPTEWPDTITDRQLCDIVERGPPAQSHLREYHSNAANWRFTSVHYFRKIENGETIRRSWLMYSPKADAIFCFCFRMFGSGDIPLRLGTSTWEGLSKKLKDHETGRSHQDCMVKWTDLRTGIENRTTLDDTQLRMLQKEIFGKML